jgi:hypothetical protein
MAITATWYPSSIAKMFNNDLNDGDPFKVALLSSSGTYNAADTVWSDVSGDEITGTGYTTGGATVTIGAATSNGTKSEFPIGSVQWLAATMTFSNAVIYQATSGALLMHLSYSSAQTATAQNYTLNAPDPKPAATPV